GDGCVDASGQLRGDALVDLRVRGHPGCPRENESYSQRDNQVSFHLILPSWESAQTLPAYEGYFNPLREFEMIMADRWRNTARSVESWKPPIHADDWRSHPRESARVGGFRR